MSVLIGLGAAVALSAPFVPLLVQDLRDGSKSVTRPRGRRG